MQHALSPWPWVTGQGSLMTLAGSIRALFKVFGIFLCFLSVGKERSPPETISVRYGGHVTKRKKPTKRMMLISA